MTPSITHIGAHHSAVVVVDDFDGDVSGVIDAAAALAPFGRARDSHYPGLRRLLTEHDGAAWTYVQRTLRAIAPFVGGAFDADRFDILEASFSLVVDPPAALAPQQRLPHYDSIDPDYLAILHYLGGTAGTGTGFYRQRSTGVERVEPGNEATFIDAARREGAAASSYIAGSNPHFEQVAAIAAIPDRVIIYQGCLLHSGIIPPELPLSTDPRRGRSPATYSSRSTAAGDDDQPAAGG